tara:strand:- start:11804 stop:12025 length:222 start_codon:yes stop_codon:yes gene_type:complete
MSKFGDKQKKKKVYATEKIDTSKTMYTGTAPNPVKSLYTMAKQGYKAGKKVVKATKENLKNKAKKKTYTGRKI